MRPKFQFKGDNPITIEGKRTVFPG
jgi:hypothetical protein